ncbi:MAG: DUF4339 domain-containing protein [Alloprevotella sp.]|nr:DUF4339 domain-containing protein [Alloprevotella sp.]
MALFGNDHGGMLNVIRCDQQDYLVWKWHPENESSGPTRANAIRFGSSLRVKAGEVAVFVYGQGNSVGANMDFIEGPCDRIIKTLNLPVLSSIIGLAYGGDTPFQAEVYFINLQQNNQVPFGIPYFDMIDPRPDFADVPVPVAVRGMLTFNVTDYQGFILKNRLRDFDIEALRTQIKSALTRRLKQVVANATIEMNIPLVQIERRIDPISTYAEGKMQKVMDEFGLNLRSFDIDAIEIDKESDGYELLRSLTAGLKEQTLKAQTEVSIQNLRDQQALNRENMAETLRIQREEAQRAQRLQTESQYMGAHALDQQTSVLKAAAESLGTMSQMGGVGGDGTGGGGMNAAGMMTGMMMGGAMGQQMAGMMGSVGQAAQNGMNQPPQMPQKQYLVAQGGQQSGPFTIPQLAQMAAAGQLTPQTNVWAQGMPAWIKAADAPDLAPLFAPAAPPAGPGAPPPLTPSAEPETQYYVAQGSQQSGPFDVSALKDMVDAGTLTADTLVWAQGMAAWTKAGEVGELSAFFAAAPAAPAGPPPVPAAPTAEPAEEPEEEVEVEANVEEEPAAPVAPAVSYYVALDGKQAGPFDFAQLQALQAEGRFDADSLVWNPAMSGWAKAGEQADLAALFA